MFGQLLDGRTGWVWQVKQFTNLVETLAYRVIQRGAEEMVGADVFYLNKLAVATGDKEEEVGEGKIGIDEVWCKCVGLDMVGGDEGFAECDSHGFGEGAANSQCCGEARASGGGDGVELGGIQAGLFKGFHGEGG